MAQWNDFINLFPELEQPVIQELKSKLVSDFEYTDYSSFEAEFDRLATIEFVGTETSDVFFQTMSSWLRDEASEVEDWETYRTKFNANDWPYIDLIIASFESNSFAEFTSLSLEARATQIEGIEGFWDAYIQMLASYIEDLHDILSMQEQPASSEIDWDSDYDLSVTAIGIGELSYQWRKNGIPIQGATSANYTLQKVRTKDSGQYDCIVSDSLGEIISTKAMVEVVSFSSEILRVYGIVQNEREAPIPNVTAKLIDRKPGVSKELGVSTTDFNGIYTIEYLQSDILDQDTLAANVLVQLFAEGETEIRAVSVLVESAENEQEINIVTNEFELSETTYQAISNYITEKVDAGIELSELDSDDIKLLENKSFASDEIAMYIQAVDLSNTISAVSAERFYGLLRLGLPNSAEALTMLSDSEIKETLIKAARQNITDSIDEATAQTIADAINGEAPAIIEQSESNPFKSAFEKVSLSEVQRVKIVETFLADPTESSDMWQELIDDAGSGISESEVNELKRIISIQDIDRSNSSIVDVLDAQVGDPEVGTTLNDMAAYTVAQWESLIDNADEALLSIPTRFEGTESEQKTAYANELRDQVEMTIPTKVIASRMNADASFDSTDFDEFFAANPDFEIGKEQIAKYVESNPLSQVNYTNPISDVQNQLESVQRLYHLGPEISRFETMKPLLSDNLTSASKIATMGATDFIEAYGETLGTGTAQGIYDKSVQVYGRVLHTLTTHTRMPGPLVLGEVDDTGSETVSGIPDLESIFGSLDYCKCTHCRSVYSPAAYLVDLLNFIDHTVSDEETPANTYNLKEQLASRRGEIEKLFLNCDNTNVPLPYIDIVNEILENYISVNYLSGTASFNQTETDKETLRATAQNVIESVYDTELISASYPHQLPFNLWFEQARAYLKESKVDIGELILAAPKGALSEERQKTISAAASMGIPVQQLNIINGSSGHSAADLYNVSDVVDIINPVSAFIDKAGVDFDELTELLKSKYINQSEKSIYFPQDGSCNLDLMTIGDNPLWPDPDPVSGLTETELKKFNYFLRLKKLTGWSIKDLDLVINTVSNGVISDSTIIHLYNIQTLKERFNLEVEEMVVWWREFDVATFIDEVLFDKLFQDTSVNHESGEIPPFEEMSTFTSRDLNEAEIKPLVLGALNLSAYELDFVLEQGEITSDANVQNFSYLYRLSDFTRTIGISIEDYFDKRAICQLDGIKISSDSNPQETLDFLEMLEKLDKTAFSEEEIAYLKSGDNTKELALTEKQIKDFLSQLRKDYKALGIKFPLVAQNLDEETHDFLNEFVPDRSTIDEIIDGTTSALTETEYIETAFNGIIQSNEIAGFQEELEEVANLTTGTAEEKVEQRKRIVYGFLQRFNHVKTDFKSATIEKLALFYDLSAELTSKLLTVDTSVPDVNFGQLLFDLEFLVNNDEIDKTNYEAIFRSIQLGAKIACIARALNTSSNELDYLINNLPDSYLNLTSLPVDGDADITYDQLDVFVGFRLLDDSVFKEDNTLIEFLAEQNVDNRLDLLASVTGWRLSDISSLVGSSGFNFEANPELYDGIDWIVQLASVIQLMDKAKLDATSLLAMNLSHPNANTAFALKNILSSGMSKKQWVKVATKIHDELRELQRDAMVAYLIAKEDGFNSANDVYDYFLIDTQMSSCQLTSRIKQSISAVQLFIQRIGLGFEGVLFLNASKMEEWNWRKNYRVWEANRKVFLYPENYLLPELRSTKSKLYDSFEEALTQDDVTSKVVEEAYQSYLEGFKEVTSLKVSQMAYDDANDILHVFATNQNDPQQFYYRTLKSRSIWTAWELIPVDIKGGILPVFENGELMVCWLDQKTDNQRPTQEQLTFTESGNIHEPPSEMPEQVRINIAWTTKKIEGWQPKKISKDSVLIEKELIDDLVMIPMRDHTDTFHISLCSYYSETKTGRTIPSDMMKSHWGVKLINGVFYHVEPDQTFEHLDYPLYYFLDLTLNVFDGNYLIPGLVDDGSISGLPLIWDSARTMNLGTFSRTLSGIWGSPSGAPTEPFRVKNQQLIIKNLSRYRHVETIQVYRPQNGVRIYFIGAPLIYNIGNRELSIIQDVGMIFPFLYKNGAVNNPKSTQPYFIQDEDKAYIIYPELTDDFTSTTMVWYDFMPTTNLDNHF